MKPRIVRLGLFFACVLAAIPGHAQNYVAATCSTISGLAYYGQNVPPGTMNIYDGPVWIGTTSENSNDTFQMATPAAIKDNQPHQIWAQWVEAGSQPQNVYGAGGVPVALTCPVNAPGYVYDHTDTTFTTTTNSTWQVNGTTPTLSGGFTNSSSSGSALIYEPAVPGVANDYDVRMTLTMLSSGGVYSAYFRATSNALESPNTGTYYDLELQNPTPGGTGTLAFYQVINGSSTLLSSTSVPCHNGMTVRGILGQNGIFLAYVDNWQYMWLGSITGIASGQPGFGVHSAPAVNAILEGDIGHLDTVAPSAPNMATLALSTAPTRADMQWAGTADDANGTGVAMYGVYRNNTLIDWVIRPEYEDNSVSASTSYTYYIIACDFAINCTAGSAFNVTTPPSGSIDPRRVGITAMAPVWGGTGENIDMRSNNLNYTIPLLKPVGVTGLSVPVNLTYNSEFWHQDSGTTWRMTTSTGYGVGWMVQAGSLRPVYDNTTWNAPVYYLFVDATGAEYRLDQVSNGVYSSLQSIYVWFDSNTERLWFKDGTYWTFGCVSAGTEVDAGTMYPTVIQDQLGNGIAIRYDKGVGTAWPDSSSRIVEIEDSRGTATNVGPTGLPSSYVFWYTGGWGVGGALNQISNTIGSNEDYAFTQQAVNLYSPFDGSFSIATYELASVEAWPGLVGETTAFSYDSSGELTQVNLPHGGHIRWTYTTQGYTGSRNYREIQNRYLQIASGTGTEYTYNLGHAGDSGSTFHSVTTLSDVTGNATKEWNFQLTTGAGYGLTSQFQEQTTGASVWPNVVQYLYAQSSSGNTYANSVTTYRNFGQSNQIQTTVNQTANRYGNPTQVVQYDYWTSSYLDSRTITNTWLEGPDGSPSWADPLYFRNRLTKSTKTDGTNTVTLVSNGYDDPTGTLYSSTTPTTSTGYAYDAHGNITQQTMNGLSTSITMDPTHNYAVPSLITTGSNSATLQWSSFLGLTQNTGQNGDTAQISYSSGFPSSTVSPYGATTTNSYTIYNSGTGAPTKVYSVTNNHFSRQTLDGVGHVILQETGTVSGSTYTTVSQVSSVYGPCGCSPMGKLQQVSEPWAPGGTPVWTTYAYDGLGRTTSVTLPDGSVTQYVYDNRASTDPIASFVDITDAAGKKKRYQMDGYGHLTQVIEDPTGLAYATTYAYDVLDHLNTVQQTRNGTTQTRTFNYTSGSTLTGYLQSATNPENGTVFYTYNSDGTLAAKVDNLGVMTGYTYDSQKRLLTVGTVPLTNVAVRKTATQSSTYPGNPSGVASNAVDGITDGNFADGSVTMSNDDAYAWWEVDLGTSETIGDIKIYNRTDCCGSRLSDYWVFVSNTPFLSTDTPATLQNRAGTWSSYQTASPNPMVMIGLGGVQGEYVRVQLAGTNYLSLAEVEVFGTTNTTPTPAYTYTYDSSPGGTNQMGRLATVGYTNAANGDLYEDTYSYTAPGEVSTKGLQITRNVTGCSAPTKCMFAATLSMSYQYDSEGHRTQMTLPTNAYGGYYTNTYTTSKYAYDQMERPVGMTDAGSGNTYVNGVQYGPANQMLQISYAAVAGGTLSTETMTYNSLVQLTGISRGSVSLTYNYTAGQDNGKIASTTNNTTGEQVVYQYDTLNRLIQAQAASNSWGQAYVYDGFGNLYQKNVTAGSAPSMSLVVDPTTNRLTNPGGTAFTYDANGNELSGPNVTGKLTYDFLNRAVFTGTAYYQNTQYAYDASNRRVWKGTMTNGAITAEAIYLYDVDGTNVGTYTPSLSVFHNGSYNYQVFELTLAQGRSYFFGKKLFVTEDNVGSAESNGTFYPFGEPKTGSTSEAYGFATYWQDSESGLDYAMNRYYSSTLGRFLSPDPYKANNGGPGDPRDPQSWNRYAYVENDPVNRNDRRGLFSGSAEDCISDPEACEDDDWGDGMLPGQPPSFPGSQTYTWQVWVGILASSATASNWGKTYGIPNFYFPLMIVEVSDTCKMGNMTGIPPTTDADRQISYQVFDQYGQPWNASTMGNITITEIVQSTGGTRVNGGGVWSTNTTNTEQLISSSGTFSDFLTLGSFLAGQLPPGSADQMFFATGAFAAIPLLIKIEGTGGYVNHNYYSHNTVLVDGTQAPGGCK